MIVEWWFAAFPNRADRKPTAQYGCIINNERLFKKGFIGEHESMEVGIYTYVLLKWQEGVAIVVGYKWMRKEEMCVCVYLNITEVVVHLQKNERHELEVV